MKHKKIVIIPTYNEAENISSIIHAIMGLPSDFDVLVVDDNSPDGTHQIVSELAKKFPERVFLHKRAQKEGLGLAYIAGFDWALPRDYDFIFEMDADFSHNPEDLIRLYNECSQNGADLAIGSRYVKGGGVSRWPLHRILLSYTASLYVRLITGMNVKDTTAGFICYKKEVLQAIDFERIQFIGYAFQVEMKYKAFVRGFKLSEVPITFTDRLKGKSKMNGSIIKEAIFGVLRMRWKHFLNKE